MPLEDLLTALAIGAAPTLLGLAVLGIYLLPRPRWVTVLGLVLVAVLVVALATYVVVWGRAFDYADAYRPVPTFLADVQRTAGVVLTAAYTALLLTAVVNVARHVLARASGTTSRQPTR